jgi:cobalt-zinc-cadmium resistance protein CzcA
MLEKILLMSVRHRVLVLIATLLLILAGARAFVHLPIDAIPDLTNVQVQILTNAPTLSPLDIERLVTVPIERAVSGLARVREVRSLSRPGVSAVTIVFDDELDPAQARQWVSERMLQVRQSVSPRYGVPELGPMATGLGEIYQFEVRGDGRSLMELRSILDWQIAPRMRLVPGVVEVNTMGGELRTYEVTVDPQRLLALNVSLQQVFAALEQNNLIAGGGSIARGPEGLVVRGEGLIRSLSDLRQVVIEQRSPSSVLIEHVGTVQFAPMLRWGAASRDARGEVVVGMAVMRLGENSRAVSQSVDETVQQLNRSLPNGVRIETFYDRTTLVQKTLSTVERSLAEGGALVLILLFLLLRNVRAGLIAAVMIPLCMLGAFIGMRALNVTGNLMSLGAIDFGLVVDGAIILLENAVHQLSRKRQSLGRALTAQERDDVVLESAKEVRSATAFGEVIIALVYVPILALEGVAGKTFRPMALTVLFALATAFVLSLTLVPALGSILLSVHTVDKPSPIVTFAERLYRPALRRTMLYPKLTLTFALGILLLALGTATRLGSEFVPQLDEGSLVIEALRLPSTSLAESVRHGAVFERVLRGFSQVQTVVTKTGRPEIANDPMGTAESDVFVMLRPRSEWPAPRDRELLVRQMSDALRAAIPGVAFSFSQPIQMRTNELVSGVRADIAVKIYGPDFSVLSRLGSQVTSTLSHVAGSTDVRADRVEGLPVLKVELDRASLARRGIHAAEVLGMIDIVGGVTVGEVLEGQARYPLRVRLVDAAHASAESLRRMPLRLADGTLIPLQEVASVTVVDEPGVVNREAGQRRLIVQANVRGRDLGGFADAAQREVEQRVQLPPGYHVEWGGQFENLRRAKVRLLIVVPLALALILALLFASFSQWRPTLLIFVNVPFAAVGGVFALAGRGMPFSISAAVGFVALFGVAVLNGLVLITQVRLLVSLGATARDAAEQGALRRLRPVLTTALVASLGFVPMALATGEGSEVQRPLATVVSGGLISATLLTLLVLPSAYAWLAARDDSPAPTPQAPSLPAP